MRQTPGKRFAAMALVLVSLLGMAIDSHGQEILDTTGIPLGGLEPWDTPSAGSECDRGIRARVTDILRPHVTRLNAAEATVRSALADKGLRAAADEALAQRRSVCEDILAVIGIVKRHNAEVSDWHVGEFRKQYVLTAEFLVSDRLETAHDANEIQGQDAAQEKVDQDAVRWAHLGVVWAPFEVVFEFRSEQRELLEQLGLSSTPWENDPILALYSLVTLLRQADVGTQGFATLAADVRSFAEETGAEYVEKYELGSRRSEPNAVTQAFETYLGREQVVPLGVPEHNDTVALELGSYNYLAVGSTYSATCMAQAKAPAPKAFLGRAVWTTQAPDAVAFCNEKASLYAVFVAELQDRLQATTDQTATQQATTLYAPYLWATAHCVPCLSAFRPDPADEGSVRFTEGWGPTDLLQLEENLNVSLTAKGIAPRTDLFLLQADFGRNAEGSWQWMPRSAGFRGYLNQRRKTTRASGSK